MQWKLAADHTCILGEGPLWDHHRNRLYWVDIIKGEIHWLDTNTGKHDYYSVGDYTGAVALRSTNGLIAAVGRHFILFDSDFHSEILALVEPEIKGNRFNDGKCDPAGRFWAGTMPLEGTEATGSLYMLEKNNPVQMKLGSLACSNGMGWSPDFNTMYFIDSVTRKVSAFDFSVSSGEIKNERTVITTPVEIGYPDGMCVDAEGMIWVAFWNGCCVNRYDPDTGKQLAQIDLPVAHVTSCCFGGESLEDIYITSARHGLTETALKEQPLSGSLFVIKNSGFKGMRSFEFRG